MERKLGYLDFNPLQDKMKIKERSQSKNNGQLFCFAIDGLKRDYYFKECSYEDAITELIACEMYAKVKIPYVNYDLACINGRYGVISRSFKNEGYKYTSGRQIIDNYVDSLADDLIKYKGTSFESVIEEEYKKYADVMNAKHTSNNFEFIAHAIEHHVKGRPDEIISRYRILNRLAVYHMADIILLNQDRNKSNWVVEESENEIGLVPTFDSADAFKDKKWMALRVQPIDKDLHPTDTYIEFGEFMRRSDNRYYNRFLVMLRILTPDTLDECIGNVEEKIGCKIDEKLKEKIKQVYKIHYSKLKAIVRFKNIISSRANEETKNMSVDEK